jgi:hypothetical protein
MDTKSTNEIFITEDLLEKLIVSERERRIEEALEQFDILRDEIETILKDDWVKIKNKDVYYLRSEDMLVPNLVNFHCSESGTNHAFKENEFDNEFEEFIGTLPTREELEEIFKENSPFTTNGMLNIANQEQRFTHIINGIIYYTFYRNSNKFDTSSYDFNTYSASYSINIPIFSLNEIKDDLSKFIRYYLIPENLNNIWMFNILKDLYEDGNVDINNGEIIVLEKFKQRVLNDQYDELNGISFRKHDIIECLKNNKVTLTEELKKLITDELLNCEKVRADIEPYDIKRLEDPNLGHWDLFTEEDSSKIKIQTDTTFVGRNPLSDIKEDGLIGIDFGTKSTIVVYQDGDDNTQPMRVGVGQFSKKLEENHFENPTVMEFIDLEDFMNRYNSREGRPNTLWEDVTVSHTAFNSLIASKSDDYYSYFNDLKQWSGDKGRQIKIRDKKGKEEILPAYTDIEEGNFDPIELYAYYIGLYINNMHNDIYLNYLLSFPVTYETKVREKILKSFERGLKKSLPIDILNDRESMNKFKVKQGPSEPAAYAICALQEYGFDPEDDEKIFYGIFDFGGGTTDFDFGIWKSADESDTRYDYVINHFGAGGDQFLGGENLLELLSFEVFKANQDKLRQEGISFLKPAECKRFAGSEILISDSQEAKLNIKQLMEKLRPLWERHEGYEKLYESGVLKVNLFDKSGAPKMNFDLSILIDDLEKIIYERIEKGVKNFFEALKLTFNFETTREMESIVIFLAGNSSKSPIVNELFRKYIDEITQELNKGSDEEKEFFKIYPPLGTKEAIKIQKEMGIDVDENDITRTTGKTGVAYGLIEGRDGGVIKVIPEKDKKEEIKFNYYIGRNRKKKFKMIVSRDVEYNKWIKFVSAEKSDFEFYYTNLPEATTNDLSIKEISKKMGRVDIADENADIYIRAVEPSVIEYTAATEDEMGSGNLINEIIRVELK